jgi:hypothetical protein
MSEKIEESRVQQLWVGVGVGVRVGVLTWCVSHHATLKRTSCQTSSWRNMKERTVNFPEKIWQTMFIEKFCRRKCQYCGHNNFPSPRLYPPKTLQTPTEIDTSMSYQHILCNVIEWTYIIIPKFLISEDWSTTWSQGFPKVYLIRLALETFQVFYWSYETNRLIAY